MIPKGNIEDRASSEINLPRNVAFVGANKAYWDAKSFYDALNLSNRLPFIELLEIMEWRAISEGIMQSADTTDRVLASLPAYSIGDSIERPEQPTPSDQPADSAPILIPTQCDDEVEREPTS